MVGWFKPSDSKIINNFRFFISLNQLELRPQLASFIQTPGVGTTPIRNTTTNIHKL
jgi:hypothetical protein